MCGGCAVCGRESVERAGNCGAAGIARGGGASVRSGADSAGGAGEDSAEGRGAGQGEGGHWDAGAVREGAERFESVVGFGFQI